MQGLRADLMQTIATLTSGRHSSLVTAVISGCELFLRFITLCELDNPVRLVYLFNFRLFWILIALDRLCCENVFVANLL